MLQCNIFGTNLKTLETRKKGAFLSCQNFKEVKRLRPHMLHISLSLSLSLALDDPLSVAISMRCDPTVPPSTPPSSIAHMYALAASSPERPFDGVLFVPGGRVSAVHVFHCNYCRTWLWRAVAPLPPRPSSQNETRIQDIYKDRDRPQWMYKVGPRRRRMGGFSEAFGPLRSSTLSKRSCSWAGRARGSGSAARKLNRGA